MPKLLTEFALIALFTLTGATYSLVSGLAPLPWAPPMLAPGEIRLVDAQALDVIWVDARSRAEFDQDHAPEAVFYDPADPAGSLGRILERWFLSPDVIVVYCSDQGCDKSKQVAEELRANLPDAEIYSLKGGWASWAR